MADVSSSIFNKRATEKLRSPDDLDGYVQVTNPGIWVVLVACIALLIGLLMWGIFGTVSTDVNVLGAVATVEEDGVKTTRAMCFLTEDEASKVTVGAEAIVADHRLKVSNVRKIPMSLIEVNRLLDSEYLAKTLVKGDWAYAVTFDGDISELQTGVPISIRIVVDRIAPISLIFRNRG